MAIYGFNEAGQQNRQISRGTYDLIHQFNAQFIAMVREGGKIVVPYGSQGLARELRWTGEHFEEIDSVLKPHDDY